MDINGDTAQFKLADGTDFTVEILPEYFKLSEREIKIISVFKIYLRSNWNEHVNFLETLEDVLAAQPRELSNIPDEDREDYLGVIAFKEDDFDEWEYIGDKLTAEQQDLIVNYIKNYQDPEDSFPEGNWDGTPEPFDVNIDGKLYLIIPQSTSGYNVSEISDVQFGGINLGIINPDDNAIWVQLDGTNMDAELIRQIGDKIESHLE